MSNFGERAWIEPDPPEPDYQAELAAAHKEIETLRAALERERMELVSASVSVSRARELTLAQEIRANNLSAALEAAKSQREAYKLSVYELREQLRHSVSEDALASAQDDLAGCRAALERERMELASASVSVSRARERTLAQEIRANDLSAALEVAQAKADVIGGQACAEARAAGRGPCGCCARCVKQATERAERSEALIKAHNERVEAACNARRKHPNCAEHAKLGTTCANCPREWMIDND